MLTLQEFDVRCRGSTQVVEEWDTPNSKIHELWRLDDLVSIARDTIAAAIAIYEQFQRQGTFPGLERASQYETTVSYFIDVAHKVRSMATAVEQMALRYGHGGNQIAGLSDLRSSISTLRDVLESVEWQEIDLIAPSDEELERYVEEVRPPADYYAE